MFFINKPLPFELPWCFTFVKNQGKATLQMMNAPVMRKWHAFWRWVELVVHQTLVLKGTPVGISAFHKLANTAQGVGVPKALKTSRCSIVCGRWLIQ